jgi:predicted nucleic acid-binding protein
MKALLDTNVISELRKVPTGQVDAAFLAWMKVANIAELYLSAITIQELEFGVLQMERRDPAQGKVLRDWMRTQVLGEFQGRILPVDTEVAQRSAFVLLPKTKSFADNLIGATAYIHDMPVITRNVEDFEDTGVTVINPWNDPQHRP